MPRDEEKKVDEQSVETETEPSPEEVLGAEAFEEPTVEEPEKVEPTKDEKPEEEPTADDTETEKPETEDEKETDAKADEPVIELVPYKVNYGDAEFEIQVTPEQAKTLDAQYKTALQTPHLQKLLKESREASEKAAAMAQTTVPPNVPAGDGTPPFNAEEYVKRMEPAVNDAVARGAMSEEFKEMYPLEAANHAWAGIQLQAITEALKPVVTQYATSALEQEQNRVKTEVYEGMATLASNRPELFGDLADQNARDGLFKHMIDLNVDTRLLQPDVLADTLGKMWSSYQGPKILEAARAASEKARQDQEEKRRIAAGGGGGGGGRAAPANDALADINAIVGSRD
jgi:hypothetical protein